MLGFILGTVCLIGLIKTLRRGGCSGSYFSDGGYGGHGYGGPGRFGRSFGGPRFWLRSVFERLQTTPGQEKAILGAIDELRAARGAVRQELEQTRSELARAIGNGLIEDGTLEDTFARHDRLLAQMRVSFIESMKKITESLDERQRSQLAQMIERRGWFGGGARWGTSYPNVWA